MISAKQTGIYLTRGGRKVELYGFNNAGESREPMAEGYFTDNRAMGWWKCEDGVYSFGAHPVAEYDLVSFEGKSDELE